jgi:hypothetical protein
MDLLPCFQNGSVINVYVKFWVSIIGATLNQI